MDDSFGCEKFLKIMANVFAAIVRTEGLDDRMLWDAIISHSSGVMELSVCIGDEVLDSLWCVGLELEKPNPGMSSAVVNEGDVIP